MLHLSDMYLLKCLKKTIRQVKCYNILTGYYLFTASKTTPNA